MSQQSRHIAPNTDIGAQMADALSPAGLVAASIYEVASHREEFLCGRIDNVRRAFNTFLTDRSEHNLRNLRREISAAAIAAERSRLGRGVASDPDTQPSAETAS